MKNQQIQSIDLLEYSKRKNIEIKIINQRSIVEHPFVEVDKRNISIQQYLHGPIYSVRLKNVILVSGKYFLTEDDYLITGDLYFHNYSVCLKYKIFDTSDITPGIQLFNKKFEINDTLLTPKATVNEPVCFLSGNPDRAFFGHWFMEYLSKTFLFEQYDDVKKYVVTDEIPKKHLEWVNELCGWDKSPLRLSFKQPTFFKEVVVSSNTLCRNTQNGEIKLWFDGFYQLRERGLKLINYKEKINFGSKKTVLYISRKEGTNRRVVDEDELLDVFDKDIFEVRTIFIEDYSIKEQIRLVSDADVLMFPMGSGGQASCYCKRTAIIIELVPSSGLAFFGGRLYATLFSLSYLRVNCTIVGEQTGSHSLDRDILRLLGILQFVIPLFARVIYCVYPTLQRMIDSVITH